MNLKNSQLAEDFIKTPEDIMNLSSEEVKCYCTIFKIPSTDKKLEEIKNMILEILDHLGLVDYQFKEKLVTHNHILQQICNHLSMKDINHLRIACDMSTFKIVYPVKDQDEFFKEFTEVNELTEPIYEKIMEKGSSETYRDLHFSKDFRSLIYLIFNYGCHEDSKDLIYGRLAERGYLDVIKYIHKTDSTIHSNPNLRYRKWNETCAERIIKGAASGGRLNILEFMKKKGVQFPEDILLAGSKHLKVVKFLLDMGVNPSSIALIEACDCGNIDVIKELLTRGADPNIRDGARTPLKTVCEPWIDYPERSEIVNLLIKHGATQDKEQYTGGGQINYFSSELILATEDNQLDIVEVLLLNEANLDLTNKRGETALDIAVKKGYSEIVQLLTNYRRA